MRGLEQGWGRTTDLIVGGEDQAAGQEEGWGHNKGAQEASGGCLAHSHISP